jgi:putative phosphoesterase
LKLAIISDIHANLEALTVCLKEIEKLKADKIICLGDLVDYCAEPNECIELVKKYSGVVVMGNHDEAQLKYELVNGFSDDAKISSVHTRSVILNKYLEYFKTLPHKYSYENLLFVHSSPDFPKLYSYILNEGSAISNFRSFKEKICFIGHSHRPIIFKETKTKAEIVKEKDVEEGYRFIINVGSIGQPRDIDPRLSFGLFDTNVWKYRNIRLEYDTISASNKIRNEGLPLFFAERILKGV